MKYIVTTYQLLRSETLESADGRLDLGWCKVSDNCTSVGAKIDGVASALLPEGGYIHAEIRPLFDSTG